VLDCQAALAMAATSRSASRDWCIGHTCSRRARPETYGGSTSTGSIEQVGYSFFFFFFREARGGFFFWGGEPGGSR